MKSLEVIFKHLVYLEKHLHLLLFTAKAFERPVYTCFYIFLPFNCFATYPSVCVCVCAPLPRPAVAFLYLNFMDKMDAYEFSSYLISQQHLTEMVTHAFFNVSCPWLSACTLLSSVLWCLLLSLLITLILTSTINAGIPYFQRTQTQTLSSFL